MVERLRKEVALLGTDFDSNVTKAQKAVRCTRAELAGVPVLLAGGNDERATMYAAYELLERLGCRVIVAADGRKAVGGYQAQASEIAGGLMDMNMPEMGGAELVRFVRNGLKSDIPVVIITTMGESRDRELGMELGANAYLTKPVDVKELIKLRTVYEHLETVTDHCEDVANIIQGIVLENS